jgi:membrane protein implicated in regulation of membrane protease activity
MANVVAISNALIIGITCSIVLLLDNVYLQLLLALALLILLQLFIYHIVGTILKRREKNV